MPIASSQILNFSDNGIKLVNGVFSSIYNTSYFELQTLNSEETLCIKNSSLSSQLDPTIFNSNTFSTTAWTTAPEVNLAVVDPITLGTSGVGFKNGDEFWIDPVTGNMQLAIDNSMSIISSAGVVAPGPLPSPAIAGTAHLALNTIADGGVTNVAASGAAYGNPYGGIALDWAVYLNANGIALTDYLPQYTIDGSGNITYTMVSVASLVSSAGYLVKVSSNDTTAAYLHDKVNVAATSALSKTILNVSANEELYLQWLYDGSTLGVNASNQAYVLDDGITTVKILDNAVTVAKLGHNIDATGIGFDAAKVDGYSVDNADATQLWPADDIFTYVSANLIQWSWKNAVISITDVSLIGAPSNGDRYIDSTGAGAFTANYIYQYVTATATWSDFVPHDGDCVYNETTKTYIYYDLATTTWKNLSSAIGTNHWNEPAVDWTTAVPGAPSAGTYYVVATGAAGVWATHNLDIALWDGAAWSYKTPTEGDFIYSIADDILLVFNGSAWINYMDTGYYITVTANDQIYTYTTASGGLGNFYLPPGTSTTEQYSFTVKGKIEIAQGAVLDFNSAGDGDPSVPVAGTSMITLEGGTICGGGLLAIGDDNTLIGSGRATHIIELKNGTFKFGSTIKDLTIVRTNGGGAALAGSIWSIGTNTSSSSNLIENIVFSHDAANVYQKFFYQSNAAGFSCTLRNILYDYPANTDVSAMIGFATTLQHVVDGYVTQAGAVTDHIAVSGTTSGTMTLRNINGGSFAADSGSSILENCNLSGGTTAGTDSGGSIAITGTANVTFRDSEIRGYLSSTSSGIIHMDSVIMLGLIAIPATTNVLSIGGLAYLNKVLLDSGATSVDAVFSGDGSKVVSSTFGRFLSAADNLVLDKCYANDSTIASALSGVETIITSCRFEGLIVASGNFTTTSNSYFYFNTGAPTESCELSGTHCTASNCYTSSTTTNGMTLSATSSGVNNMQVLA